MNILIVCGGPFVFGKEKVMLSLLQELKFKGYNVHCVTASKVWTNGEFVRELKDINIPISFLRLGFITKTLKFEPILMTLVQFLYLPFLWIGFIKITNRFKPDVIIHTNFHHSFLLYPILKKSILHIYHCHESVSNSKFYRFLFLLFEKKITYFVGVSQFIAQRLIDLGLPDEKVCTIYNGFDIVNESNNKKEDKDTFNIGIVGQVSASKGHEDLINAIAQINEQTRNNTVCSIFGPAEGVYINFLKEKIKALNINNNIIWEGYKNDKNEIYSKLDLVCVPSVCEEALSMTALEASAYSIPLIVTKRGGLSEVVIDNVTGFIIEANSPSILAEKISLLYNDKALRLKMGKLGHKRYLKEFNLEKFVNNWINLISSAK